VRTATHTGYKHEKGKNRANTDNAATRCSAFPRLFWPGRSPGPAAASPEAFRQPSRQTPPGRARPLPGQSPAAGGNAHPRPARQAAGTHRLFGARTGPQVGQTDPGQRPQQLQGLAPAFPAHGCSPPKGGSDASRGELLYGRAVNRAFPALSSSLPRGPGRMRPPGDSRAPEARRGARRGVPGRSGRGEAPWGPAAGREGAGLPGEGAGSGAVTGGFGAGHGSLSGIGSSVTHTGRSQAA